MAMHESNVVWVEIFCVLAATRADPTPTKTRDIIESICLIARMGALNIKLINKMALIQ